MPEVIIPNSEISPDKLILHELDDSYSWMKTLGQFMTA